MAFEARRGAKDTAASSRDSKFEAAPGAGLESRWTEFASWNPNQKDWALRWTRELDGADRVIPA
jgi:hypothetical protein